MGGVYCKIGEPIHKIHSLMYDKLSPLHICFSFHPFLIPNKLESNFLYITWLPRYKHWYIQANVSLALFLGIFELAKEGMNYLLATCLNIQLQEDIEIYIPCDIWRDVLGFDLCRATFWWCANHHPEFGWLPWCGKDDCLFTHLTWGLQHQSNRNRIWTWTMHPS